MFQQIAAVAPSQGDSADVRQLLEVSRQIVANQERILELLDGRDGKEKDSLYSQLGELVRTEQFDAAFNTALSKTKLEVVVWLCSHVEPGTIFHSTPIRISQPVLLSLVQQLSFELSKDTALKLSWLKLAVLHVDTQNSRYRQHVPKVMQQLQQSLEEIFTRFSDNANPLSADLRLLMHVVSSMLK